MEMIWDTLLAAVCVLGLALVAWWLFGRLFRPMPGQGVRVLIPGRGEGEDLEQTCLLYTSDAADENGV